MKKLTLACALLMVSTLSSAGVETPVSVDEPATLPLMLMALLALWFMNRKK